MKRCLTFDDVGLVPKHNCIRSRGDTNVGTEMDGKKYDYPVVPANMDTVISKRMADVIAENNGMIIYHRFCSFQEKLDIIKKYKNAYMSCGVNDFDELKLLIDKGCNNFCIDVAHGHSEQVKDTIKFIKKHNIDASIIAGNVCTYDGYEYLAKAGANIIKVGVGGGSICCTRIKTAFGVPQFSAVQDCCKAKFDLKEKENINTWLIADGGIKNPRDAVLSYALGADMVMMGSIFAKTIESAGKKFIKGTHDNYIELGDDTLPEDEDIYSHYRGQASSNFMKDYYGDKKKVAAEGIDYYTKCTGKTIDVINEYSGSLRSALTYNGSQNLEEFKGNVEIFESTSSYMTESNTRTNQ